MHGLLAMIHTFNRYQCATLATALAVLDPAGVDPATLAARDQLDVRLAALDASHH